MKFGSPTSIFHGLINNFKLNFMYIIVSVMVDEKFREGE